MTPGPWTVCFTKEDNKPISFEITALPHGSIRPICGCSWSWEDGRKESITLVANAHLIAAAPDLLEALEQLLDDMGPTDDGLTVCQEAKIQALEALAKAKGRN